ncbi:response regulator receiver protein [Solidesulfovibrio fructosivorans JJ]]|uniref:Response regulator receiver protein n=1 Tax=Solidesulfovibrio fructosivorans JJ] TaxID=596151 RepID=E1K222_SOLFR|nr:response regulator [Solidesulfovibrio fructosivorans]EFL49335.1 response regulator receiver protein [Solidesulfovibrio fructosivorans JJ]]
MTSARVMIVEDEAITAMATGAMLKRMGHKVTASVGSGAAALEAFRRFPPDLVLMDIRLDGDMDGIETARAIRADSDVPVVFVTAYVDAQTRRRAAETSPFGFVPKPLDEYELDALFSRLRAVLPS